MYSGGLTHLLQAQSIHLFLPPGWHGALKIMKGHNSTKIIDGDWVLVLCISSDGALYLCQVSRKYLERFLSYRADMNDEVLADGGMDGHSNLGRYNICYTFLNLSFHPHLRLPLFVAEHNKTCPQYRIGHLTVPCL